VIVSYKAVSFVDEWDYILSKTILPVLGMVNYNSTVDDVVVVSKLLEHLDVFVMVDNIIVVEVVVQRKFFKDFNALASSGCHVDFQNFASNVFSKRERLDIVYK
jgi:hypothetical protein